MDTGTDRHRQKKIAWKVLKIAAGSCMAVAAAQFLKLPYATSAGIIALLTVRDTRLDTIQLAIERFLSFLLSILLVFVCFRLSGRPNWISYGVYIFLMVNACYFFGWQNTISVNAVMGTHYLLSPNYSLQFALNELTLIIIGTSLALAMNWRMPSNLKVLQEDIQQVENDMKKFLRELALYLDGRLDETHIWTDLDKLEASIHRGLERAREQAYNTLSKDDRYYIEYMEMRLQQCAVLQTLRHRVWKISEMPSQSKLISNYVRFLSQHVHERNIPDLQQLQHIFEYMKRQPLPQDREEFESRAILYHVLLDLEDFLAVKQRFADQYIRGEEFEL